MHCGAFTCGRRVTALQQRCVEKGGERHVMAGSPPAAGATADRPVTGAPVAAPHLTLLLLGAWRRPWPSGCPLKRVAPFASRGRLSPLDRPPDTNQPRTLFYHDSDATLPLCTHQRVAKAVVLCSAALQCCYNDEPCEILPRGAPRGDPCPDAACTCRVLAHARRSGNL